MLVLRFFCLVALASLFGCLSAPVPHSVPPTVPQEIGGQIQGRLVLSGQVVFTGDVLVPRGSSLVIEPGTEILVPFSESTKIDPEYLSSATELLIRGTLEIRGTARQPVRFIPQGVPAGEPVAWAGIILDSAETSRIEHAEITRAETGILCISSSALLRNNQILGCRYGIIAQRDSSPEIRGNRISGGEGGVFCWWNSHPLLAENQIAGNEEEGLFVDRASRPTLRGNRITGNGIGLAQYGAEISGGAGQFQGNRQDHRILAGEGVR